MSLRRRTWDHWSLNRHVTASGDQMLPAARPQFSGVVVVGVREPVWGSGSDAVTRNVKRAQTGGLVMAKSCPAM